MDYGNKRAAKAAADVGLPNARMISWSKSAYRRQFPDHLIVFNATICDDRGNGLWWGDVDVTVDEAKLRHFAGVLGRTIHVLHEGDARPDSAPAARFDVARAVARIGVDGTVTVPELPYRPAVTRKSDGQLVWAADPPEGAPTVATCQVEPDQVPESSDS